MHNFAGSPANYRSLMRGLTQGAPVTLTDPGDRRVKVSFTAPVAALSTEDARHTLLAASELLASFGIYDPTLEEVRASLIGGVAETTLGKEGAAARGARIELTLIERESRPALTLVLLWHMHQPEYRDYLLRLLARPAAGPFAPADRALILEHDSGASHHLSDQYFHDLLVWHHLRWTGETVRRGSPTVTRLMAIGTRYSRRAQGAVRADRGGGAGNRAALCEARGLGSRRALHDALPSPTRAPAH